MGMGEGSNSLVLVRDVGIVRRSPPERPATGCRCLRGKRHTNSNARICVVSKMTRNTAAISNARGFLRSYTSGDHRGVYWSEVETLNGDSDVNHSSAVQIIGQVTKPCLKSSALPRVTRRALMRQNNSARKFAPWGLMDQS